MQTPSPEQKLEIALRVHETFDLPKRWHQGGWGRDDDGDVIEFDGGFHVVDNDEVRHRPAFRLATPESPRCFCLGAAIRIHAGSVLSPRPVPYRRCDRGHVRRLHQARRHRHAGP